MQILFQIAFLILQLWGCSSSTPTNPEIGVNDVHSRLNKSIVKEVIQPKTTKDVQRAVLRASKLGLPISIAGSKHAMGGQQFISGGILLDMRKMNKVLRLDKAKGILTVQAGAEWPEILDFLKSSQSNSELFWTFRQKQTGADRLSIGGALSANIHGRGLIFPPFVDDVVAFKLVNAEGKVVTCSRSQNSELFNLVIGGYGLFGVITEVDIKLVPRKLLLRKVWLKKVHEVIPNLEKLIKQEFLYGDWQFEINDKHPEFLTRGVISAYKPIEDSAPLQPEKQKSLSPDDWEQLIYLAHFDKKKAWDKYTSFYLSTDSQKYWSDEAQLSYYPEGYHLKIDQGSNLKGSEMITELYVPRKQLGKFMRQAAQFLRKEKANVIYGTVRLIEKDTETFLAWAREPWACIVFNLHVEQSEKGLERAKKQFQGLIDIALNLGGSFFLTYHRWATKSQILRAYPQFVDFLKKKLERDPQEIFQSDWYRHYKDLFKVELGVTRN